VSISSGHVVDTLDLTTLAACACFAHLNLPGRSELSLRRPMRDASGSASRCALSPAVPRYPSPEWLQRWLHLAVEYLVQRWPREFALPR